MIFAGVFWFWLVSVTPSPGWSTPILVTEEANTQRPVVFIHRDEQGRFHLVWAGYKDSHRIAYKMFDITGTTIVPDTMISRNTNSVYLSTMVTGDSLYAFWREYNPVYYSLRSLTDGSEIVPATYLFTTSTLYPYIRACPDSLGRLHVLYNDGGDVRYAVWTPAPGSGFTVERDWKIEGADAGGVLLVDGNRVHIVVQDPDYHDYCYLQYDLDGNTIIPLTDFTVGDLACSRDPRLALDLDGNLMVVEDLDPDYVLWKLDKFNGLLLVDQKTIVTAEYPEMYLSVNFILEQIPDADLYYLAWADDGQDNQILFLLMNGNGDIVVDWAIAYDYADEDPEDLCYISGQANQEGNLFLTYEQGESEPILGYYPTFGWFDYDYVSTLQQEAQVESSPAFSFSSNPVTGSVTVFTGTGDTSLRVFDLMGREVSDISVSDGVGVWNGAAFSGERLPAGIYNIIDVTGNIQRITLLNQ